VCVPKKESPKEKKGLIEERTTELRGVKKCMRGSGDIDQNSPPGVFYATFQLFGGTFISLDRSSNCEVAWPGRNQYPMRVCKEKAESNPSFLIFLISHWGIVARENEKRERGLRRSGKRGAWIERKREKRNAKSGKLCYE